VVTLTVTYLIGRTIEARHYKSIRQREQNLRELATVTLRTPPPEWQIGESTLVMGSVVISLDYFKRFAASLRALVGGPVKSFEPLLDRARREALLRMREQARARGFDAVINTRLETSRLASSGQSGKGTAGIEILAYGTAIKIFSRRNDFSQLTTKRESVEEMAQ
jgi:uncharacterized protein YbjQ (UPF0145 family)